MSKRHPKPATVKTVATAETVNEPITVAAPTPSNPVTMIGRIVHAAYRLTFGAFAHPVNGGQIAETSIDVPGWIVAVAASIAETFTMPDVVNGSATMPDVVARLRDAYNRVAPTPLTETPRSYVVGNGFAGLSNVTNGQNGLYLAAVASGIACPVIDRYGIAVWIAFCRPVKCDFAAHPGYWFSTRTDFVSGSHGSAYGDGHRDIVRWHRARCVRTITVDALTTAPTVVNPQPPTIA